MVPHVAESPRRVDKTAVLRFSAHGMRINYGKHYNIQIGFLFFNLFFVFTVFGRSVGPCHPRISDAEADAFLKLMDSFMLTVTCRGKILLVSQTVENHLGHCQVRINLYLLTL